MKLDEVRRPQNGRMQICSVCGWQPATRKGRCNSCSSFFRRHGRDKNVEELVKAWERAIDKAFDLKDWR